MTVFIDTSAFFAVLDADDSQHKRALQTWHDLLTAAEPISTSNYVLLETLALLQRRVGLEAVRQFEATIMPLLHVIWIDAQLHDRAVSALLAAGRRQLSLVDCASFVVMRQYGLNIAFTFDGHFAEQGFTVLP